MVPMAFVVLVAFLLLSVFAAANWAAFTAPATLSLLVTTVDAPLGLVMLGAVIALGVASMTVVGWWQTSTLIESRRQWRELQVQRELADRAEASRLVELRAQLETDLAAIRAEVQQAGQSASTEAARAADGLAAKLQDGVNALLAATGEIEDKLDRVLAPGPGR